MIGEEIGLVKPGSDSILITQVVKEEMKYKHKYFGKELQDELCFKYYFQEQACQDELGLNWDSFKYRNYDYAIGRFMSVDPLAEKYAYNGVYNFSENRVLDGRELEGLEWESIKKAYNNTLKNFSDSKSYIKNHFIASISATASVGFQAGVSNGAVKVGAGLAVTEGNTYMISNKNNTNRIIETKETDLKQHNYVDANIGISKKLSAGVKIDVVTESPTDNPKDVSEMISTKVDHINYNVNIGPKTKSSNSSNTGIELSKPKVSQKIKAGNEFKGIDVSFGAKFILGIDINLKIGFE